MTTSATSRAGQRMVLAAMTLANAMILVDQTAVPLALPDIAQDFRVSSLLVQWVLTASLLPLAGLLVLGGRLGDLLGRRRVFLLGSVVFAGASAVGGVAPDFTVLIVARVLQGSGGALMLPATVAILSSAFDAKERGRALGAMGGIAATAGALGPTIGGLLTSAISWRAVLLVNLPLLAVTLWATLRAVPPDPPRRRGVHVDLPGAALLGLVLVGLVFGLAQTTTEGWTAPDVLVSLAVAVLAAVLFVVRERRVADPLLDLGLLARSRDYRGATISQALAGMAEMGLGLILPLALVLNLEMDPALAGLALLATTVPMVAIAPLVGRWYDKAGGRPPLVVGFALLAVSGVLLALGMPANDFWALLPGLVVYGVGLAVVLTVNDPVGLDTVPERDHGQASGVSATAEQGGGAVGIALLYALLHLTYIQSLVDGVAERGLPPLTPERGIELRDALADAQQTGLVPRTFDPQVVEYLDVAERASDHGYVAAFLAVTVLAVIGAVTSAWLVRRPPDPATVEAEAEVPDTEWGADGTPEPGPGDRDYRHPVRPARLPSTPRSRSAPD
ncbi:EmrB/QacA subfamily drug resistance transporter [Actinomycetospora succinea]|uniref:EmrB/QacA subfamily drug resistance transporter n=1 Tax=Actinomycetospora succinea TaxID=663603 RepID=A0A4R6UL61_9PSEU|nr:MFS transporter [Actinomycetospora succinea]TDQ47362.1 EmrB/QacA subfamily drug resistance transporter [Actinomycetospora succinea]